MPTPTDLRAALRDACKKLHGLTPHASAAENAEINAWADLADAPPTVAELLPRVDATHRVRWLIDGNHREAWAGDEDGIIQVSVLGADDRHAQYSDLQVADLTAPARLVEVSP